MFQKVLPIIPRELQTCTNVFYNSKLLCICFVVLCVLLFYYVFAQLGSVSL